MSIPVYRHNKNHDDWEVASVYGSDDCDSLGRSAYNESLYSAPSEGDHAYDDARLHVRYSVPASYLQGGSNRPRLDAPCAPGRQNNTFIVPPPGVIFPTKERLGPLQEGYWPPTPSRIGSPPGLIEPPPPSLLLSPTSPPRTPSPHIGMASPVTTTIGHVHAPHAMTSTGANANGHASVMAPTARYHDLAHTSSVPRLAETGCQAHPGMVLSPPRKSGHDVLSPCPSYRSGMQSSEEMTVYGGNGGPGSRPDLLGPPYEPEGGRRWGQSRERRPSIWRRFVRRFNPSHVSVGQT